MRGSGFSGRVPHLLHSGRPLLYVARPGLLTFVEDAATFPTPLTPWRHFVPVQADLSDLLQQAQWVVSHPHAAARIGACARALARRTLTLHASQRHAVRLVLGAAACADACGGLPFGRHALLGGGEGASARRSALSSCRGCMDASDPASPFSRAFRQHAALMPEEWAAPQGEECDIPEAVQLQLRLIRTFCNVSHAGVWPQAGSTATCQLFHKRKEHSLGGQTAREQAIEDFDENDQATDFDKKRLRADKKLTYSGLNSKLCSWTRDQTPSCTRFPYSSAYMRHCHA